MLHHREQLVGNPAAAQNVAANWPTKIVWSGYEVGDQVHTGQTISSVHPTTSPVRAAYRRLRRRQQLDLLLRPDRDLPRDPPVGPDPDRSRPRHQHRQRLTGGNTFTTGAGNQYYLVLGNATALDSSIETLLDVLPPGPPPSDTFDRNTLSPSLWTTSNTGSSVAAVSQELQITHPAGSWTTGMLQSAAAYDITGKSTQIQVMHAANDGLRPPRQPADRPRL